MNRNVSQMAKLLGENVQQVKQWAWLFKEYLSSGANPPKGKSRLFTDADALVFSHVCMLWEANPDLDHIKMGLNQEDHFADKFIENLYLHTPLLQEPPGDLDETWRHGVLINGGRVGDFVELARNYRQGAEALLDKALKADDAIGLCFPVLFAYRHTLELYLKIIGEIDEPTHSLKQCVHLVENHHGKKIGSPVREWILELDKIDPTGTAFRYADDEMGTMRYSEYWLDFVQFAFAMKQVFDMIDNAIIRIGARGKPAKKRKQTSGKGTLR